MTNARPLAGRGLYLGICWLVADLSAGTALQSAVAATIEKGA